MKEIRKILLGQGKFLLAGHVGPDGDTIGSSFALGMALRQMGKQVAVVLEPFSSSLDIIPGKELLVDGDYSHTGDTVSIALDCASPERLGETIGYFEMSEKTICIDHHESNTGWAKYNCIESNASSTAEMVYRLIEPITDINKDIATALYAGMVTDTGGFRYNATAKSTMEIAAKLMETGVPFTEVYSQLMHMHKFLEGKALGIALSNSSLMENGKIVYSHVEADMLKKFGAKSQHLEGTVEYLMGTRGALVAVLVYERSSVPEIKASLRSKGPNVGNIASMLGGGGHKLAAGATTYTNVEETLRRTLDYAVQELRDWEASRG